VKMGRIFSYVTKRNRLPLMVGLIAASFMMMAVMSPIVTENASAATTNSSYKYVVYPSGSTYYVKNANGAVVYSSTNAASAIQKAIDSLTSGRTTKETVLLQGTFTLTKAIQMRSYTILQLSGKITMGTNSNTHMATASGISNFEIVGGEWNANQAAQSLGGVERRALDFASCKYATIKDLNVHDAAYGNIVFYKSSYITISNVETYNAGNKARGSAWLGHGIFMYVCNNCVVENCHIHNTAAGGCYFYTENDGAAQTINNNVMRGNLVERTETSGLSISLRGTEDKGVNNLIEKNKVVDCGVDGMHYGINLGYGVPGMFADKCTVRDNVVYETGRYYSGTGVGGGIVAICTNSLITKNIVHDTTDVGISVRGDSNTISYNDVDVVRTKTYPGIQIVDGNKNKVLYNTVSNCVNGIAIHISKTSGSSYNQIAYNQIENMAQYVVTIANPGSTGNIIEYNKFVGTHAIGNKGTGTIIRGNT